MKGIDSYATMQQMAARLDRTDDEDELERMRDDLVYVFEVLDPELKSTAESVMERVCARLTQARRGWGEGTDQLRPGGDVTRPSVAAQA